MGFGGWADEFQIPAQQQALDVSCHSIRINLDDHKITNFKMPNSSDIDSFMDDYRQSQGEFEQFLKKANSFTTTDEELTQYKSELQKLIPKELNLSTKQLTLMKFFEKDFIESTGQLKRYITRLFQTETESSGNQSIDIDSWRSKYLSDIRQTSEEYLKLINEMNRISDRIKRIKNQYGVDGDDFPLVNSDQNPLKPIIDNLFKGREISPK